MKKILPILFLVLIFQSCSDDNDVVIPDANMYGCMQEAACNYDHVANINDDSCWYEGVDNDPECTCEDGIGAEYTAPTWTGEDNTWTDNEWTSAGNTWTDNEWTSAGNTWTDNE